MLLGGKMRDKSFMQSIICCGAIVGRLVVLNKGKQKSLPSRQAFWLTFWRTPPKAYAVSKICRFTAR